MNTPLSHLEAQLAPFALGLRAPQMLSNPAGMVAARARVEAEHSGPGITANIETITSAVEIFRRQKEIAGFRELKYVCLGVGAQMKDGWRVVESPALLKKITDRCQAQPLFHKRLRCFQALLSSYWLFPLSNPRTSQRSIEGWNSLRDWLQTERGTLARAPDRKPAWFQFLSERAELLSDAPCKNIGEALLAGDASMLNAAKERLAIPDTSWVHEEALFAQVQATCRQRDEPFARSLDRALAIICGRGGVEVGERIRNRAVATLASRYARSSEHPEHASLRDAAVDFIGNPWLKRSQWDALVVDADGEPDGLAREMVDMWLKDQLIADFFELLSIDGSGDKRRVKYWQRYVPYIDEMWFALGSSARTSEAPGFAEFRKRAKGRLLRLEQTTSANNAFVMRMGRYLAVEYGSKGNAFFFFELDAMSKRVRSVLSPAPSHAAFTPAEIRDERHLVRLIHADTNQGMWEEIFDESIHPLVGFVERRRPTRAARFAPALTSPPSAPPSTAKSAARGAPSGGAAKSDDLHIPYLGRDVARGKEPTAKEWNDFVAYYELRVTDHRKKGGALWVEAPFFTAAARYALEQWGFRFRAGRGWFKE